MIRRSRRGVEREELEHRLVGSGDVGQRVPRARPNGRGPCPRRTTAGCRRARSRGTPRRACTPQLGFPADGVAVVEDLGAGVLEPDHRLHVKRHRSARPVREPLGIALRVRLPPLELHAERQIGERVVSRSLVGNDVDRNAASQQLGQDEGAVALEPHAQRDSRALGLEHTVTAASRSLVHSSR